MIPANLKGRYVNTKEYAVYTVHGNETDRGETQSGLTQILLSTAL